MPKVLEENFIIYSDSDEEYIPFFTRYVGDSGRDIAAVKIALGQAYSTNAVDNQQVEDNSIGVSWFDCSNNSPITSSKMRLFDKQFKISLMNYQFEKQFVIMSYYYEKHCIQSIRHSLSRNPSTSKNSIFTIEISKVLNMFESEFGTIGEGTLACLHGWRPNSVFNNYSFITDNKNVIDEVPKMFLELIEQGAVASPRETVISSIIKKTSEEYQETYELFKKNTHSKKIISDIVEQEFVYPVYSPSSYIGVNNTSTLASAAQTIMSSRLEPDIYEIQSKDRYKLLSPMLEPDPLTDPDPFEIGSRKIGFFDRTEFTLEKLPDFSNISDLTRQNMEDEAFHKILKFYKKPLIWEIVPISFNSRSSTYQPEIFSADGFSFSNEESLSKYIEAKQSRKSYRITTNSAIREYSLSEDRYDAIYGVDLLEYDNNRFINFIEYRTPSLRPGDVYRAYFEASFEFLNQITRGQGERNLNQSLSQQQANSNSQNSQYMLAQEQISTAYCAETSQNEDDAQVKFEKYKAFAMKRKLEISRILRSAALQRETGDDVNVDLGVFGNIPFANILDGSSLSSEDLVEGGFSGLSDLVNYALQDDSLTPAPGKIKLPVKLFEESIMALEKIFRSSKVQQDIKKFKIASGNQQELNLDLEADNLAAIPGYLEDLAFENEDLQEQLRTADGGTSFQEFMTADSGLAFGYTMLGETTYEINFQGIEIFSIALVNRNKNINAIIYLKPGAYKPLAGSLSMPRTVNYIRNINNMLPIPSSGKSPMSYVEDIVGLNSSPCTDSSEEPSLGASLILRYTIHNDGSSVRFEPSFDIFKPFHNWKENYLEREEIKRLLDFYEKATQKRFKQVAWGVDDALPVIGPTCNFKELYRDVFATKNLSKLLCNYLTCLRIPDVNIKFPNFTFPEIPEPPVFEYPGLNNLADELLEVTEAILTRIVCATVRNIFDILASPFCEEQLTRDLFGAAIDSSPQIQRAAASAFLDVGIPKEKASSATSMVDDLVKFVTPRELCALLNGTPVNGPVYTLISNFAKNYNLEQELSGREKITQFFTGIGVFLPDELCQGLKSNKIIGYSMCEETTNALMEIRNIASRGTNVDADKVEQAVQLAEKNLLEKGKAFQLLTGEIPLSEMFPDDIEETVKAAPVLMESSRVVVDCTLDMVKTSFLSSMNGYVRSLYLDVSNIVTVDDDEYDPVATMRFLRATNNLLKIQNFNVGDLNFESQNTTLYLRRTLLRLVDDFEKIEYKGFEVYRSQLDPESLENITNADEAQTRRQEGETLDTAEQLDADDFAPFDSISGTLKGSLVFGTDLTQELIESGITGLMGINTLQIPSAIQRMQTQQQYNSVFNYLFPLSLEITELDTDRTEEVGEPIIKELTRTDNIINWQQWNSDEYIGKSFAQAGEERYNIDPRNVSLNISYLNAIISIVQRLQRDIEETLEPVFKVVSSENLLEIIRDFYNINLEAMREQAALAGEESARGQLISTDLIPEGQKITLEHPVQGLLETVMSDKTLNSNYISNETSIDDEFFLGKKETISLCEEVPEEYKDFFDESDTSNPLRRKVFKEQISRIAKKYYDEYKVEDSPEFENIEEIENLDELEESQYLNVLEGVMEQMISYMGESRMFSDTDYLFRLDSKIKSRRYFEMRGDNACIINPQSSFDQGAIKFSDIVTDIFPQQYQNELMDPSNSIFTLDYSKPGPFEKAMMTTSVIGYVRMVCFEALMKGAIAYSSWDIDFVTPDPLFREYVYRLVINSLETQPAFQEYSTFVDDAFQKMTGTSNRISAVKKIVDRQLTNSISILCKVLFENDEDEKYVNWFLNRMFIVDAPKDRALSDNSWISELSSEQIYQYRKNAFTYMERYIRVSGSLNDILIAPGDDLAENQKNALFDFIRFNDNYSDSFYSKLYNETDPEFMNVPIVLDIPTTEEVESFEIGNQDNLTLLEDVSIDNDQWPEKELWSLEDFTNLLISIFNNNPGVQKYIYHLLMKYYDDQDQTSLWHGKPKTLREKMPVKAIRRKRQHFIFNKRDDFSHKVEKHFEDAVRGSGAENTDFFFVSGLREQSGKTLHDFLTAQDGITPNPTPVEEDTYSRLKFDDRFYIASSDGVDLFEQDIEESELPGNISDYWNSNTNAGSAPNRGLVPSRPLPWQPRSLEDTDVIKTGNQEWVTNFQGLEKNSNIYKNVTGEVTEEEYLNFISATQGILKTETWEEYVIDLVGDASPIFDQIGESGFDPEEEINSSRQEDIANYLKVAANCLPQENGEEIRHAHRVLLCPSHGESPYREAVFATDYVNTWPNWRDDNCETNTGPPSPTVFNIARGPGFVATPWLDNISTGGSKGRQYTYFKNNLKIKYNSATEKYDMANGAEILLGQNDYKVPLRILITQVKDQQGNILKVFARHLIPKALTFNISDTTRGDKVAAAVRKITEGFTEFFVGGYELAAQHTNPRADALFNSNHAAVLGGRRRVSFPSESEGEQLNKSLTYLLGLNDGGGNGGNAPVFTRTIDNQTPGNQSHAPSMASISKIWSYVGLEEAELQTGHFTIDEQKDSFSEFDKYFKRHPGKLLRKPTGTILGPTTIGQQLTDLGFIEFGGVETTVDALSQENEAIFDTLKNRISIYNRASQHSLYESSLDKLIETDSRKLIITIGNLVGWYSQRRIDGFYGATHEGVHSDFSQNGVRKTRGIYHANLWIAGDAGLDALKNEAADFDCGPSLFYGDGRFLFESYMAGLRKEYQIAVDSGIDAGASFGQYRTTFKHYREQNLYKLRESVFADTGAGSDIINQPGTLGGKQQLRETNGGTTLIRPKTLATLRSDVHTSQQTLFQLHNEIGNDPVSQESWDNLPVVKLHQGITTNQSGGNLGAGAEDTQAFYDFFSNLNLMFADFSETFDNVVSNPQMPTIDYAFADREGEGGGEYIVSSRYGDVSELQTSLNRLADEIRQVPTMKNYFDNLREERERYPQVLEAESQKFDQALQWAEQLIRELYRIIAGLDPRASAILEELNVKHGLRMNLAIDQIKHTDILDFRPGSNYDLGSNLGNVGGLPGAGGFGGLPGIGGSGGGNSDNQADTDPSAGIETSELIKKLWHQNSEAAEEERIGRLKVRENFEGSTFISREYTSIPIAAFERDLYIPDPCEPSTNLMDMIYLIRSRDNEMITGLSEQSDFKTFYEFSVPYRKIGSLLTIHSTSMLAGYSGMPSFLSSTKSSLASVFRLMASRNNFNSQPDGTFGTNFSEIEIASAMGNGFPAGGESLDCFSLPGLNEWFTMLKEMIAEFILNFPAVVLRGIADQIDPAYKEMKSHYYACETPTLNLSALGLRAGNDKTEFGLRGKEKGSKKYIPIFPSFPIDLGIGTARMLNLFNSDGGAYLGKSIDRLVSYTIGGPKQLIDASYAFQVPCLEDENWNQTGDFRNWSRYMIGNYGRYGHPLTPITLLALSTRHLPRDREYRSQSCQISSFAERQIVPGVCNEDEE